jgi:tetratricopeptide (TPR) repeat protein
MEAYDYVLRGRDRLGRLTRADNIEARRLFKTAAELDPGYATAFVGLGLSYLDDMNLGWTDRPEEAARRAYEFGHRAITLDDHDGAGHLLLAQVYCMQKQHGLALAETDRAIDLNPNDADGHAIRGMVLIWSGRPEEAIASFETAARFDPSHTRPRSLVNMGMAYLFAGRLEEATRALELSTGRNPEFVFGYIGLAVAYHELGKRVERERAVATVRRLDPFFTSGRFGTLFANEADRLRIVKRLSQAGL